MEAVKGSANCDHGEAREGTRHLFLLACLAQKSRRYSLARSAWDRYQAVRPCDPKAHHNLGVCLDALGEKAAALASFEKAFELQPCMADAGSNAAGLLLRTGRAEDAERACALCYLALEGDPSCAAALHNLNTALRMVGRRDEAVAFSWRWIWGRLGDPVLRLRVPGSPAAVVDGKLSEGEIGENKGAGEGQGDQGEVQSGTTNGEDKCGGNGERERGAEEGKEETRGGQEVAYGEGELHGGGTLTVACVRWGNKYGPEYVERLAAGVRRNLQRRHRFVCYTDNVEELRSKAGIVAMPLGERCGTWRGWWHKAFLFSREAGLAGRVLFFDLDTVVVGSLDDLASYAGPFAALSVEGMANERRPSGLNSSVMSWDAGGEAATLHPAYGLLRDAYGIVTGCVHKLDHWLEMVVPAAATLQDAFPGQVVEYNSMREVGTIDYFSFLDDTSRSPPPPLPPPLPSWNARVVCFPLEPKPHEVPEEWLQLNMCR